MNSAQTTLFARILTITHHKISIAAIFLNASFFFAWEMTYSDSRFSEIVSSYIKWGKQGAKHSAKY